MRRDEARWREAEAQWKRGESTAFESWRRLDPALPHGRQAAARLQRADGLYRRAIELLRTDQLGLRETLSEAMALAPIDPALYLPLARACRDRGALLKAADFYRKYLASRPAAEDASTARGELDKLAGDLPWPEDPPPPPIPPADEGLWRWAWLALASISAALVGFMVVVVWLRRRRLRPLREVILDRPELHQTVAYQLGCLRHEFLKHRIGAAGEALRALGEGRATPEQRHFLDERFCKGEPLLAAWRAHVGGLERSLGLRFTLPAGDPLFRDAQDALAVLTRAVTTGKRGATGRVAQAREQLERLDRELAALVNGLAVCPVDEALLRDALQSIRSEWSSGKVELDEVLIGPVPQGLAVDVYRTDLRIVLKNILRNAIAALGESPRPRRLAVDVLVELEPTGEEVVRIRVRDSSAGTIELGETEPTGVEHGLGIVRTALERYDGSLELAAGGEGYSKAVVVRLFRSQAEGDANLGGAA